MKVEQSFLDRLAGRTGTIRKKVGPSPSASRCFEGRTATTPNRQHPYGVRRQLVIDQAIDLTHEDIDSQDMTAAVADVSPVAGPSKLTRASEEAFFSDVIDLTSEPDD